MWLRLAVGLVAAGVVPGDELLDLAAGSDFDVHGR